MAPESILLVGALLLGTIVGSFINALSYRFNTGVKFFSARGMGGRSRCMHCSHILAGKDLIPVVSFLLLKGKCRYCHSRVSAQYPLVEVVAALVAVLLYVKYPLYAAGTFVSPLPFLFWFVVWMTLLFVVVYDAKHTIIPWSSSLLLMLLTFVSLFVDLSTFTFHLPTVWLLLAGPLCALPLFLLSLVSKGTWMGWADSGLELSMGWMLGLTAGFSALMLAFWIGAVVGIILMGLSRLGFFGYTIRSELPFAPFIVLGALLAFFFNVDFLSSYATLFSFL